MGTTTWLYNDKEVVPKDVLSTDSVGTPYGFVYRINYIDGTFYLGKKNFYKNTTLPALKSGEQRPNSERKGKNIKGKRVYFDIVTKESDWETYEGSSENTKELEVAYKEILQVAYSKRELTYLEVKLLFWEEALEDENCHNISILKLFFRENLR